LDCCNGSQRLAGDRKFAELDAGERNMLSEFVVHHQSQRCTSGCANSDLDSDRRGKFDSYGTEGLTLLPGGALIDVDTYGGINDPSGKNWETYSSGTGAWTLQGSTPDQLWNSCGGTNFISVRDGSAAGIAN
jgi:hypothetical protein